MESLRAKLEAKRDENPPPNDNKMQPLLATNMLEVLSDFENGKISKAEYKRQMKLIKLARLGKLVNGKTDPLEYTGMAKLLDEAIVYFD